MWSAAISLERDLRAVIIRPASAGAWGLTQRAKLLSVSITRRGHGEAKQIRCDSGSDIDLFGAPGIDRRFNEVDVGPLVVMVGCRRVPGNDLGNGDESPCVDVEVPDQSAIDIEAIFPGVKPGVVVDAPEAVDAPKVPRTQAFRGFAALAKRAFMHKEGEAIGWINATADRSIVEVWGLIGGWRVVVRQDFFDKVNADGRCSDHRVGAEGSSRSFPIARDIPTAYYFGCIRRNASCRWGAGNSSREPEDGEREHDDQQKSCERARVPR